MPRTAEAERADVLAYLQGKQANARTIAEKCPEFAADAQAKERAWAVAESDIANGLHEGEGERP